MAGGVVGTQVHDELDCPAQTLRAGACAGWTPVRSRTPTLTIAEAMVNEFKTVASWTADAVEELGPEHALPAGCRGSGRPAALRWIGAQMGMVGSPRLLDCGAGLGGPAEFAVRNFGADPTLVEPMPEACRAAARLFGRPVVVANGEALPFATGAFDAAWSLGVLCTMPDQAAFLDELRRAVVVGGPIGLLVFLKTVDALPHQPEGNHFPTRARLQRLISEAGLRIQHTARISDFSEQPLVWQESTARVDDIVARDDATDQRWAAARDQQQMLAKLIEDRLVVGQLLVVRSDQHSSHNETRAPHGADPGDYRGTGRTRAIRRR
jgi:SAM-dependent methyltransferase